MRHIVIFSKLKYRSGVSSSNFKSLLDPSDDEIELDNIGDYTIRNSKRLASTQKRLYHFETASKQRL